MLYFKYGSKLAIEQNQKEGNGIKYKEEKGKKNPGCRHRHRHSKGPYVFSWMLVVLESHIE
jgi:hypothetical protein